MSLEAEKYMLLRRLPTASWRRTAHTETRAVAKGLHNVPQRHARFSCYAPHHASPQSKESPRNRHMAAIAFGSNIGDRLSHIESALRLMREKGLTVEKVSRLYETKPMYYEDQDLFLNGACQISTSLDPEPLLDVLQEVETDLGRERLIEKGPRTMDLDIVAYDEVQMASGRLNLPHKLLHEREFVLRPVCDVVPLMKVASPLHGDGLVSTASEVYEALNDRDPFLSPVTALAPSLPFLRPEDVKRKTQIMAIVNVTPDSFSDGGKHSSTNIDQIRETARRFIGEGASIVDIGGQSTRPRAELISPSEELRRILPAIEAVRGLSEAKRVAISVDTFYSGVAAEAVAAGADIINDVSAGMLDPEMLRTVARLGKTIVLMHMRGDPHTMTQMTSYPDGVIEGVAAELGERVQAAQAAGIPSWRLILDPGIGFAKNMAQNLELLRKMGTLRTDYPVFTGLPWLVGTSRKGFIGKITETPDASDRLIGTAAAVTASIAGGADIVRVHDVAEMAQVVKMADAIYRTS